MLTILWCCGHRHFCWFCVPYFCYWCYCLWYCYRICYRCYCWCCFRYRGYCFYHLCCRWFYSCYYIDIHLLALANINNVIVVVAVVIASFVVNDMIIDTAIAISICHTAFFLFSCCQRRLLFLSFDYSSMVR